MHIFSNILGGPKLVVQARSRRAGTPQFLTIAGYSPPLGDSLRDARMILIGIVVSIATFTVYWLAGPRERTPNPSNDRSESASENSVTPKDSVDPESPPKVESNRVVPPLDVQRVRYPFRQAPIDPYRSPDVTSIPIPDSPGGYAIWGATGRDVDGRIWFGVSAQGVPIPSAHLYEYSPDSNRVVDRGDVISELVRCGVWRDGEGQMKIHSRIVQAADGYLYFASMDEQGERTDGSRLPTWGSHLWRLDPAGQNWEHLVAAPEALIAVANGGKYLYALGYFGHVLYQFNFDSRDIRSVRVGSVGGHISRNFMANENGHAYVPRLRASPADASVTITTLVEFDSSLREIAEFPLQHYTVSTSDDSHGIIAFEHLADRSIIFVTDQGYLYRIVPHGNDPSELTELGWFHPAGRAYVASMFTGDGVRYLMGVSSRPGADYEWLVYDLDRRSATTVPLIIPQIDGAPPSGLLLYGSMTRDNSGAFYIVGTFRQNGQSRPAVFQLRP